MKLARRAFLHLLALSLVVFPTCPMVLAMESGSHEGMHEDASVMVHLDASSLDCCPVHMKTSSAERLEPIPHGANIVSCIAATSVVTRILPTFWMQGVARSPTVSHHQQFFERCSVQRE